MFDKILIANRGEIACRVIRACRDMGIASVAIYSEPDKGAAHVTLADEAVEIGGAALSESYLNSERIIDAAKRTGAQAIHPGYGFLSENATFARACGDAGIVFIGPPPSAMSAMGEKVPARELMKKAGVPIVPGSDALSSLEEAREVARTVGYPILLKASAGGGGIGMRLVAAEDELADAWEGARSTAQRAFGNDTIFIEHFVEEPRHIEVQVIADTHGSTVYVGERECSIQRRHQKIVEETPSCAVTPAMRQEMGEAAVAAARAVGYVNAGTVEFIASKGTFFFLEMNTRLQVEHPITEEVYGVDLVVEQIRVAAGLPLSFGQEEMVPHGHAIECRVNAEDPSKQFRPSPGRVTQYREPDGPGVRVDSALTRPSTISPHFDPMVAKVIVWGRDREAARARMKRALREYVVSGVKTNISYHLALMDCPDFVSGNYSTHLIEAHPELIEVAATYAAETERMAGLARDGAAVAAIAGAVATVL